MTIDMTHERQIELAVRDAREEGREYARNLTIARILKNGRTPEQIAEFCGYDLHDVLKVQEYGVRFQNP